MIGDCAQRGKWLVHLYSNLFPAAKRGKKSESEDNDV